MVHRHRQPHRERDAGDGVEQLTRDVDAADADGGALARVVVVAAHVDRQEDAEAGAEHEVGRGQRQVSFDGRRPRRDVHRLGEEDGPQRDAPARRGLGCSLVLARPAPRRRGRLLVVSISLVVAVAAATEVVLVVGGRRQRAVVAEVDAEVRGRALELHVDVRRLRRRWEEDDGESHEEVVERRVGQLRRENEAQQQRAARPIQRQHRHDARRERQDLRPRLVYVQQLRHGLAGQRQEVSCRQRRRRLRRCVQQGYAADHRRDGGAGQRGAVYGTGGTVSAAPLLPLLRHLDRTHHRPRGGSHRHPRPRRGGGTALAASIAAGCALPASLPSPPPLPRLLSL
mmetsp:Transcript_6522/g.23254  ORF Transcript_6522/g.23254 Transcript_6522/m.23254 type:complete len:342 (+) Transcript_6522:852-1877(+)